MVAPLLKPLSLSRGEYIFHRGDPLDARKFGIILSLFPEKGDHWSSLA